jgi:6-phosphogluconate dehydrogenase
MGRAQPDPIRSRCCVRWFSIGINLYEGVPVPVISPAFFRRFELRGAADYAGRLLFAMRKQFGGIDEERTGER